MGKASFTSGQGVIPLVFSVNPVYPGSVILESGAVRAVTEAGDEYVYDKGAAHALIHLKFEGMPASEFDGGFDYASRTQASGTQSLVNWFFNVADMGGASFTYTDPFGKEHQVSFTDNRLEFALTDHGLYAGSVILKERLG